MTEIQEGVELPEPGVRLELHLADCAACSAFAAEVAGVAEELRAASLEPAPAGLFVAHRRRRIAAPVAAAAATLVIAVAAGASCVLIFPDRGDRYLETIYSESWVREKLGEIPDTGADPKERPKTSS